MPQSGAVHSIKLRRTQYEPMFSASPSAPDIARRSRHFAFVPTSDLCLWESCVEVFRWARS